MAQQQQTQARRNGERGPPAATPQQQDPPPRESGDDKQRPVHKVRLRSVTAAVWQNQSDRGPWYSVTVSRSYRDDAGNWHTAENYSGGDLLLLAEVSRLAFLWIERTGQAQPRSDGQGPSPQGAGDDSDIPF